MSRRFSHPNYEISQPGHYYYDNAEEPLVGGSLDEQTPRAPVYGQLETATLQSEISMSVVTDDTRFYYNEDRRGSLLRRLTAGSLNPGSGEEKTKCCGIVNVEPVMLLLSIVVGFLVTSQPLFTYWARCYEIANNTRANEDDNVSSICAQLTGSNSSLQDDVEMDIASTKIYLQIANSIPTLLVAPLVGTWSDKNGRKAPLIFTMVGFLAYTVFQLFATLTYQSMSIYFWYFIAEFVSGMTGGATSMFATALAIVTDDCRNKLKPGSSTVPLRIGVASFVQSFGTLIGTFCVSMLTVPALVSIEGHSSSYVKAAIIQASFAAAALVYAILFVRETHFPNRDGFSYNQFEDEPRSSTDTEIEAPVESAPVKGHFSGLAQVLLERRPGWTRCCLILSLFFIFVEFLALDTSLLFLLTKRAPFSWTDKLFSQYSLIRGALFALGMVLCPLALTRVHWLGKDSLMIMGGIAASAGTFFLIAQATTTEEIFCTTILALFCGAIAPGYRSFLPRMVPKEQTARLLTVCSIIMAFCPIVSAAIFNSLFNWSIDWWPGFAFFIGGLLQIVVVIGQIGIHTLMRPQWSLDQQLKAQRRRLPLTDGEEATGHIEDTERSVSNTAVDSEPHYGTPEDRTLVT